MFIQLVPIPNLRYEKVTYYTVRVEGRAFSEFRDFQQRMSANPQDLIELNEIRRYIQNIGNAPFGAEPRHFKPERAAERLPPPYHWFEAETPNDYGLRLYCIRLSRDFVILLNGGRKTNLDPEKCDNCRPHFRFANALANVITTAIIEGNVTLNNEDGEIEIEEDFELEI